MQNKNKIAGIVLFMGLVLISSYFFLLERKREGKKSILVVYTKDLVRKNSIITTNRLILKEMELQYVQPGSFSSLSFFMTNHFPRYYTLVDIASNVQVTGSLLGNVSDAAPELLIPRGMRGVDVLIADKDFFNSLKEGTLVDFFISLGSKEMDVLKDILIFKKAPDPSREKKILRGEVKKYVYRVTVLLSPQDTLKFFYLINKSYHVVCRNLSVEPVLECPVFLEKEDVQEQKEKQNEKMLDFMNFQ